MMKTWKEADDVYSFPAWQARHKNEEFVEISWSMVESPAWNSLGKNAIRLYLKCMEWTCDAENRKEEKANEIACNYLTRVGLLDKKDEYPSSLPLDFIHKKGTSSNMD